MAYKQQKFISHSSGGWKSEIQGPAWLVEDPLPGCRLLVVFSCGGMALGVSVESLL